MVLDRFEKHPESASAKPGVRLEGRELAQDLAVVRPVEARTSLPTEMVLNCITRSQSRLPGEQLRQLRADLSVRAAACAHQHSAHQPTLQHLECLDELTF